MPKVLFAAFAWALQMGSPCLSMALDVKTFTITQGEGAASQISEFLQGGNVTLFVKSGTYIFPDFISLEANTAIIGESGVCFIFPAAVSRSHRLRENHQGQSIVIKGNNVRIQSVEIDGRAVNGGICAVGSSGITIRGCVISNCGSSQAILVTKAVNFTISENRIARAGHGIQIWQCQDGTVSGNTVSRTDGGGIWQAWGFRIIYSGNLIRDCGDVGLDIEGGRDIKVERNIVGRCKNAELAVFKNRTQSKDVSDNIVFAKNQIQREAVFTSKDGTELPCNPSGGAATIFSLDINLGGKISFENNFFMASFGYLFYHCDVPVGNMPKLVFRHNTGVVRGSAAFFRFLGTREAIFEGNCFVSEVGGNKGLKEMKNCSNFTIRHNLFADFGEVNLGPLFLQSADRTGSFSMTVEDNVFVGLFGKIIQNNLPGAVGLLNVSGNVCVSPALLLGISRGNAQSMKLWE